MTEGKETVVLSIRQMLACMQSHMFVLNSILVKPRPQPDVFCRG